jgi:hypothetical protein
MGHRSSSSLSARIKAIVEIEVVREHPARLEIRAHEAM